MTCFRTLVVLALLAFNLFRVDWGRCSWDSRIGHQIIWLVSINLIKRFPVWISNLLLRNFVELKVLIMTSISSIRVNVLLLYLRVHFIISKNEMLLLGGLVLVLLRGHIKDYKAFGISTWVLPRVINLNLILLVSLRICTYHISLLLLDMMLLLFQDFELILKIL